MKTIKRTQKEITLNSLQEALSTYAPITGVDWKKATRFPMQSQEVSELILSIEQEEVFNHVYESRVRNTRPDELARSVISLFQLASSQGVDLTTVIQLVLRAEK